MLDFAIYISPASLALSGAGAELGNIKKKCGGAPEDVLVRMNIGYNNTKQCIIGIYPGQP